MSTAFDPMKAGISLHGLGFIQVQLPGGQRLHVWHPDLPRRRCFEHSAIHSHRFDFTSLVLVGTQININYGDIPEGAYHNVWPTHVLYLHEGPRSPNGGRPWTPNGKACMTELEREEIKAGNRYYMPAYRFHLTEPGGNGKVATFMTKHSEGQRGAQSSCLIGIEPDTDFDRFQLTPAQLWAYVIDVLSGGDMPNIIAQAELALLQRVEQMAAYYEGPKGYFDWIDQQKAMRMPTGTGSPEGRNLPQQEADQ